MRAVSLKVSLSRLTLAAALVLACPSAWADGPTRPATPTEKAYYDRVMAVLAKAIPAQPPTGWVETDRTEPRTPQYLSEGIGEDPMGLEYHAGWSDVPRAQAAQAAQAQAGAEVLRRQMAAKTTAAQEKRMQELADQLGKAMERGDRTQEERIQKELERDGEELGQIYGQREAEIRAAMKRHQVQDVEAGVSLLVNSAVVEFMERVTPEPPVAGLTVYRQEGEDNPQQGWREGYSWVFLGAGWKLMREGDHQFMEFQPKTGVPHTTVQNLVVRIQAAPARARALLAAIDWAALKALVK